MVSGTINQHQLRDTLTKNWMTHEALWYGEVAAKFGMAKAKGKPHESSGMQKVGSD